MTASAALSRSASAGISGLSSGCRSGKSAQVTRASRGVDTEHTVPAVWAAHRGSGAAGARCTPFALLSSSRCDGQRQQHGCSHVVGVREERRSEERRVGKEGRWWREGGGWQKKDTRG